MNEVLRPDLKKAMEVKARHKQDLQEYSDLEGNLNELKQVGYGKKLTRESERERERERGGGHAPDIGSAHAGLPCSNK